MRLLKLTLATTTISLALIATASAMPMTKLGGTETGLSQVGWYGGYGGYGGYYGGGYGYRRGNIYCGDYGYRRGYGYSGDYGYRRGYGYGGYSYRRGYAW